MLNGYWENFGQETSYPQNQEFWRLLSDSWPGWRAEKCHRLLTSARTGRRLGIPTTWTATRTAEDIPSRRQSHCSHHYAPQRTGPAQIGGRRVDVPSCRPVLLQEKKRNDDEVRLQEACNEHMRLLSNYNILVLLLVAPNFRDNENAEWDGCFPGAYPLSDGWRAFSSELSGLVCRVLVSLTPPAFCPFHLFSRLCPEESVVPCVSPKYII